MEEPIEILVWWSLTRGGHLGGSIESDKDSFSLLIVVCSFNILCRLKTRNEQERQVQLKRETELLNVSLYQSISI